MTGMCRLPAVGLAVILLASSQAAAQVTKAQLTYETYAAGLDIMQMHAFFGLGPWNYRVDINYHTTGLAGFFYRGRQINTVRGIWNDDSAQPLEFFGVGTWHGQERRTLIDYNQGQPFVKELEPPQATEREPVPPDMQLHTMDTLSALAQLMHNVAVNQRCETSVRTYDGRRVLEIVARDGGSETLEAANHSIYSGPALRCDFEGREIAGFLIGEDDPDHRRPLRGSAWLAPVLPGDVPLPARVSFQTRWFGLATMYLTGAEKAEAP